VTSWRSSTRSSFPPSCWAESECVCGVACRSTRAKPRTCVVACTRLELGSSSAEAVCVRVRASRIVEPQGTILCVCARVCEYASNTCACACASNPCACACASNPWRHRPSLVKVSRVRNHFTWRSEELRRLLNATHVRAQQQQQLCRNIMLCTYKHVICL
jgi:hypothetical protein